MKCLIADDEKIILENEKRVVQEVLGDGVKIFEASDSDEAYKVICENDIQVAFLDVDMPFINGIELAKKIKERKPRINIIFVTAYEKYAYDAIRMYASGFILKPIDEESLKEAMNNLRYPIAELYVKCFGRFEVLYDGKPVNFKRSQCKEVLAYLIDKRGSFVSEDEIRYLLWSEEEDTEKKRRYVRNIISDIRMTLKSYGLDDVIINNGKAAYAVNRENISCDLYDYLDGKIDEGSFEQNGYMEQFSWGQYKVTSHVFINKDRLIAQSVFFGSRAMGAL